VLGKHRELRARSQYNDCSDQPDEDVTALITLMCETINRFAPPNSQYLESIKGILRKSGVENAYVVPHVAGVLNALHTAYDAGYLATVTELIHADVFADFVQMASTLFLKDTKIQPLSSSEARSRSIYGICA
jgi:hypothetical protein